MSATELWDTAGSSSDRYCTVAGEMKLINRTFYGDRKELKDFIDNVATAFELVEREQHDLFFKYVQTKITGGSC